MYVCYLRDIFIFSIPLQKRNKALDDYIWRCPNKHEISIRSWSYFNSPLGIWIAYHYTIRSAGSAWAIAQRVWTGPTLSVNHSRCGFTWTCPQWSSVASSKSTNLCLGDAWNTTEVIGIFTVFNIKSNFFYIINPYWTTTRPICLYFWVAGTLWDLFVKSTFPKNLCILQYCSNIEGKFYFNVYLISNKGLMKKGFVVRFMNYSYYVAGQKRRMQIWIMGLVERDESFGPVSGQWAIQRDVCA